MLIREIATEGVKTATPDFSVRNVLDLLRNNDFRHVPIVDQERNVRGIVSESDILASASMARVFGADREEYESFLEIPVGEFLKTRFADEDGLVAVEPSDPVAEAIQLLLDHKLSALPVVEEDGSLFGIVSYIDVLNKVLEGDESIV